jgi:hypothetical protein
VDTPTPTPTPEAVTAVSTTVVSLDPGQFGLIVLALLIVVFAAGFLVAVKL